MVKAVEAFWLSRGSSQVTRSQGGSRDAVVGGKNMNGFIDLVARVVVHCGLPEQSVHTRKSRVVLSGFFRATMNWDVLVIHERRLLGIFEFKSQVGSISNNFNNRSEEVIVSAADLWVAHHHGASSAGPRPGSPRVGETSPTCLHPPRTQQLLV